MATFLVCALLLSLERICYVWAWRHPHSFVRLSTSPVLSFLGGPRELLEGLFCFFKLLQLSVFVFWCFVHGHGRAWPPAAPLEAIALGIAAIVVGQALNVAVFRRLGRTGVFYGARFGHDVPWSDGFPFSWLTHPQYVGAVLSIWGVFLILRFPHDDWIVLPLLETLYYALGARAEC